MASKRESTAFTPPSRVVIVFYTMYGHVYTLAEAVKRGVESSRGMTVEMYQVPETLSDDVLAKMEVPGKPNVPILWPDMYERLVDADGILFGIPTRFGLPCAQMKSFFDSTGALWTEGKLVGKPAGVFTSTSTQGGGQETTIWTTVTQLAHHGMIYVPPGYGFGPKMFDLKDVHGGSPFGAGTIAGADSKRIVTEQELQFAQYQGAHFGAIVRRLKGPRPPSALPTST